jgi:hypothetical protein
VLPFFKKSENYHGCDRGDNRDGVKSGDRGDNKDGVKSGDRGENKDGVKSGDRDDNRDGTKTCDRGGNKSTDRGEEGPSCPHHGRGGPLHVRQGVVQYDFFL